MLDEHENILRLHAALEEYFAPANHDQISRDTVLRLLDRPGWTAYLVGGTLRDIMAPQRFGEPRDIDIVVDGASNEDLAAVLRPYLNRRTRFGGLHLRHEGWLFDVWALAETWAFKFLKISEPSIERFPRTTFLDLEGVAAELFAPAGKRRLCTNGFFKAMTARNIEINLVENPYPKLCVIRSLITAAKMSFTIGPRLAAYLLRTGAEITQEQLQTLQLSHYDLVRIHWEEFGHWLSVLSEGVRADPQAPTSLPVDHHRRVELWSWVKPLSPAPSNPG
ncbi:MAG TPA: hypothetical protein VGQ99_17290 [Tepidisphaeraceae bacterium]|jgi:hypothetical protein|nr:hypothetical protein [Tepidisphaeraceae bacterium]